MLIITDAPLGLVKYHVKQNNEEGRIIKCIRSTSIRETTEAMLTGVDYDSEGELVPVTYIIQHDHAQLVTKGFRQDANNITYLVVSPSEYPVCYGHLRGEGIKHLKLAASQYQHEIAGLGAIMEPDAFPYFWSEYCVGKFKSNPIKWYNEGRYLLFLFKERGKKKFSCEDLDFLYNKVSDTAKDYLRNMYTDMGKHYILMLTPRELFVTFIKGPKYRSPVQKSLEQYKPEMLYTYMCMKEAFFAGKIRLSEAVIVFDYLLNTETTNTTKRIRNLFNIT